MKHSIGFTLVSFLAACNAMYQDLWLEQMRQIAERADFLELVDKQGAPGVSTEHPCHDHSEYGKLTICLFRFVLSPATVILGFVTISIYQFVITQPKPTTRHFRRCGSTLRLSPA